MKTVTSYFKLHSKNTLIRLAIISFICLVIVTLVANGVNETYTRRVNSNREMYDYGYYDDWVLDPQLGFFVAFSVVLTTLLPILELSCFNNRRYLDSAFSFPISRTAMISVNLINGFLHFLTAYTLSFIWYAIMLLPCASKIGYPALWSFFFISLLCSLFYYSVNAFFFTVCNSSVDGFLTALVWQFIICPVILTFDSMFGKNDWTEETVLTILWMPLGYISDYYTRLSKGYDATPDLGTDNQYAMLIYLIVIPILTALFIAGTLCTFDKKRAESAGEISNTPFSYKVILPVCSGLLIYWAFDAEAAIIAIFALIFSTVGYIIYRRTVKLKIADIIVIAACFVCFVMGLLGW